MSFTKVDGVTVTHKGTDCDLYVGRYAEGMGVALQLVERATGEPWTKATVNIPEMAHALLPGQVFVKDWSENEGVMAALEQAGVARRTDRFVNTGYVRATIADLLLAVPDSPPVEAPEGP